jgi:hypothetical protein
MGEGWRNGVRRVDKARIAKHWLNGRRGTSAGPRKERELVMRYLKPIPRLRLTHLPDDGKVGQLPPHYTAQHHRRQSSAYSTLWEPDISTFKIIMAKIISWLLAWTRVVFIFITYNMAVGGNDILIRTQCLISDINLDTIRTPSTSFR